MKETRSILNSLVACGIALAMVSTLAAQTANQSQAQVLRIKGGARYKVGNNDWQTLKVGDIVRQGTVIQTAGNSRVDVGLGEAATVSGSAAGAASASASSSVSYQPTAEQNIVRIWENTLIAVDKLTQTQTGADIVTETQLDLKAGHITGSVKKMSAASKYEVKIPNGVAGIRGTVYDISAEGLIKVLSGSVVLAYVGPSGVTTQVIMGQQQFDARTGTLSPLPPDKGKELQAVIKVMMSGVSAAPTQVLVNQSLNYISPH